MYRYLTPHLVGQVVVGGVWKYPFRGGEKRGGQAVLSVCHSVKPFCPPLKAREILCSFIQIAFLFRILSRAQAGWAGVPCLPVKAAWAAQPFFWEFSTLHREGTGTCCATLQAPARKQEQNYSFFYALHSALGWVFLQGVLSLFPLLFWFTSLQFLFPIKITTEKVNICCYFQLGLGFDSSWAWSLAWSRWVEAELCWHSGVTRTQLFPDLCLQR